MLKAIHLIVSGLTAGGLVAAQLYAGWFIADRWGYGRDFLAGGALVILCLVIATAKKLAHH